MNRGRWKAVERSTAAKLNKVLSGVGNKFTPIERIPLLGREGPDLTVNESGLVINVKSRGEIPERLFPQQNEIIFMQDLASFRLDELAKIVSKDWIKADWTPQKRWKRLADWYLRMDKWTKENRRECITAIVIHRPRMPIGHAGVVIQTSDLRRLQCQINQH